YSYQEKKENYDFQSVEDVKVRWKNLPPLFDDKGNPRKPNDKERAELKGPDKKSPGYQADFADLRKDMTVEVHVPKPNAKPAKDKLINVGRLVGKVATVEGSTKNLTVQISLNYPVVVRAGRRISYSIQTINQDVELQAADDIKVRIPKPPPAFDDKGRPKKYSEKELRELKGPGNLPGYTG